MAATIKFWGMYLNQVARMNLIFALGISIDYSVHIAHKYLIINQSSKQISKEAREYKARLAISQMGTSVLHGGFSTLIVVCILGFGQIFFF